MFLGLAQWGNQRADGRNPSLGLAVIVETLHTQLPAIRKFEHHMRLIIDRMVHLKRHIGNFNLLERIGFRNLAQRRAGGEFCALALRIKAQAGAAMKQRQVNRSNKQSDRNEPKKQRYRIIGVDDVDASDAGTLRI